MNALTECGLPGIERIPYGLHACHFYASREALVEALVPYFMAGLRNNERCLWVTAPPLPPEEASRAIERGMPGALGALASGALRITDFDSWYTGGDVVQAWLEEEKRALAEGFSGLRITGNTSFLHGSDFAAFMEYERAVSAGFHGRRIVALCSYSLELCTAQQVIEATRAHPCSLDRHGAEWALLSGRG